MHHVRPVLAAAMAASMIALLPTAYGHGEGGHGKAKAAFDPSKVEEKSFGRAGNPKRADRTIHVGMHDTMQFVASAAPGRTSDVRAGNPPHAMPTDLVVKKGETIRFIVHNDGKVMHEMVIGTLDELKAHAELMRKFPDMEHDEPYMAHVAPGKKGELVWQFTKAGVFHYACLVPGHMEAGMIAKITVQ